MSNFFGITLTRGNRFFAVKALPKCLGDFGCKCGLPCGASGRDLITHHKFRGVEDRWAYCAVHSEPLGKGCSGLLNGQPAKEVVAFEPSHQSLKFPSPQEADVSATSKLQIRMPRQFSPAAVFIGSPVW